MLSTIVTMLYIRASGLIHLITESLYPFTNFSLVSTGNRFSTLCFYQFIFFWIHIYLILFSIWLSLCVSSHLAYCPTDSSMLSQMSGFPSFLKLNIPLHVFHIFDPSFPWWTLVVSILWLLLDHKVAVFLISVLFSIVVVPTYISTNSVQVFPFLHILTSICYLLSFDDSCLNRCEVISHCGFDLHGTHH